MNIFKENNNNETVIIIFYKRFFLFLYNILAVQQKKNQKYKLNGQNIDENISATKRNIVCNVIIII